MRPVGALAVEDEDVGTSSRLVNMVPFGDGPLWTVLASSAQEFPILHCDNSNTTCRAV